MIAWLFATRQFVVRGGCGGWDPALTQAHNLGDVAIAAAYFTIPVMLILFWARQPHRDQRAGLVVWLFALFILGCGWTHLLGALSTWWPAYRFLAVVKIFTGILSWATAAVLVPIIPRVLREVSDPRPRVSYDGNRSRSAEAGN
jgi:hypothetical protein